MSQPVLESLAAVVGPGAVSQLRQLGRKLSGRRIVHVNSTRQGGGVAEILQRLAGSTGELGIDSSWLTIDGDREFFSLTKTFHNGVQGDQVRLDPRALRHYEEVNRENARRLRDELADADVVYIHDPQPAGLINEFPGHRGKWIWRCHIDASNPDPAVWDYLRGFIARYDASVFSLPSFAQPLPHPQFIIPPSIDPLSEKNAEISADAIYSVYDQFRLDPARPILLQVSRFDRFKDPVGVIRAYRMVKVQLPVQLVLAGSRATDDPECDEVMAEVEREAGNDPDIHVLLLPPDANLTINALQRAATIVLQKSLREGFGLTVTEAMWKGKPVIGGATGGITLQVANHHTGFLVHSPEGAALRIRYLLNRPDQIEQMGRTARAFVREHFLRTRQLRDYLALILALTGGNGRRIELN